jgi:hypothetical protein
MSRSYISDYKPAGLALEYLYPGTNIPNDAITRSDKNSGRKSFRIPIFSETDEWKVASYQYVEQVVMSGVDCKKLHHRNVNCCYPCPVKPNLGVLTGSASGCRTVNVYSLESMTVRQPSTQMSEPRLSVQISERFDSSGASRPGDHILPEAASLSGCTPTQFRTITTGSRRFSETTRSI